MDYKLNQGHVNIIADQLKHTEKCLTANNAGPM